MTPRRRGRSRRPDAPRRSAARCGRLRRAWHRLERGHDALFVAPWRQGLRREARRREDLFVALVFLDAMGLDDPTAYWTLEARPHLVAAFHDWHRRQGLERSPTPGVCC